MSLLNACLSLHRDLSCVRVMTEVLCSTRDVLDRDVQITSRDRNDLAETTARYLMLMCWRSFDTLLKLLPRIIETLLRTRYTPDRGASVERFHINHDASAIRALLFQVTLTFWYALLPVGTSFLLNLMFLGLFFLSLWPTPVRSTTWPWPLTLKVAALVDDTSFCTPAVYPVNYVGLLSSDL